MCACAHPHVQIVSPQVHAVPTLQLLRQLLPVLLIRLPNTDNSNSNNGSVQDRPLPGSLSLEEEYVGKAGVCACSPGSIYVLKYRARMGSTCVDLSQALTDFARSVSAGICRSMSADIWSEAMHVYVCVLRASSSLCWACIVFSPTALLSEPL